MIFVDREEELSWLFSLYESRKKGSGYNAIIFGLRRVGKSTILNEFVRRIDYGIVLDLSYITNGRELIESVRVAVNELIKRRELKNVDIREPKNTFDSLKVFLEYLEKFALENNIVLAVCLDEFHVLLENLAAKISLEDKIRYDKALEKVFWYLKSLIPRTKNIFWVLSTSVSWHLIERYSRSPAKKAFLALFTVREIKPLDEDSSIKLARKLSKSFNSEMPIGIAKRIYEVTGGIPALIEILVSHIAPKGIKEIDDLNQFLEDFSRSTELNDYFDAIINFFNEVSRYSKGSILSVLRSLSEGFNSPNEIAKRLDMDYNVVYNILEELVEAGLLVKEKVGRVNFYFHRYPLMKTWLLSAKPYIGKGERDKIRHSLGVMFDHYIKGLFEEATKINSPVVLEEKNGKFFNNTIDKLEILPIYHIEVPRGPPEIQIDLIAIGKIGRREIHYLIENKYTTSPIGLKDIEKFSKRVKTLIDLMRIENYRSIIIQGGDGGFHPSGIAIAIRNNIVTLTKLGLIELARKLDYQKII